MSAEDKSPQWIRVSTSDMFSQEGRYILGGRSNKEWADYGRWFALLQLLGRTADGYIDVSDPRRLKSLASDLAMQPKACKEWLAMLVEGGAVDREAYETKGRVCVADVFDAVQSYKCQVRANRRIAAQRVKKRERTNDGT